jgi:hypothetical protein
MSKEEIKQVVQELLKRGEELPIDFGKGKDYWRLSRRAENGTVVLWEIGEDVLQLAEEANDAALEEKWKDLARKIRRIKALGEELVQVATNLDAVIEQLSVRRQGGQT